MNTTADFLHDRRWRHAVRWLHCDPRAYQIATLGSLVVYGVGWLGFDVPVTHAVAILVTVLLTQLAATRITGRSTFDPKSALISGLSLCLLLRTNSLDLAVMTAIIAIASKFVLRVRGKHIFNPTNFALVAMILLTGSVWVSPGQWGSAAVFGFLLASAGGLVVNRAARSDVTLAFLFAWVALVTGRSLWLGEPLSIPLHRLESGALVLFAFFMISDPKTTPDSRSGRVLFAVLVAAGAWVVQFKLFRTNGLLWSLALFSVAVPLIDRLLPGPRYVWGHPAGLPIHPIGSTNGEHHEAPHIVGHDAAPHTFSGSRSARFLRLLRRQGGHKALQPGVPGRARP
jgi:enediyne biosynthesis protein E5